MQHRCGVACDQALSPEGVCPLTRQVVEWCEVAPLVFRRGRAEHRCGAACDAEPIIVNGVELCPVSRMRVAAVAASDEQDDSVKRVRLADPLNDGGLLTQRGLAEDLYRRLFGAAYAESGLLPPLRAALAAETKRRQQQKLPELTDAERDFIKTEVAERYITPKELETTTSVAISIASHCERVDFEAVLCGVLVFRRREAGFRVGERAVVEPHAKIRALLPQVRAFEAHGVPQDLVKNGMTLLASLATMLEAEADVGRVAALPREMDVRPTNRRLQL